MARLRDGVRTLAHGEAALRLVVEHHDELGAIIGLAVRRLVRDDDRRPRQGGRRNEIEHLLRELDAIERVLGGVAAVDGDRIPAQAGIGARDRGENVGADRLVGILDVIGNSRSSNCSPPSGSACGCRGARKSYAWRG